MNDQTTIGVFIIAWLFCAILGAAIGSGKGSAGKGFLLGLLLGIIGVIIVAVLPTERPQYHWPSGWYDDPWDATRWRYYDERAGWTVGSAPKEQQP